MRSQKGQFLKIGYLSLLLAIHAFIPHLLQPEETSGMPKRGYICARPAASWEEGLISGNGKMGAMVMGEPLDEIIIFSHERLFMPWEKPIPPVDTASHLAEIRQLLSLGGYQQAADLVVNLSKKQGYGAKRWTDPFIPAFDLRLKMKPAGEIRPYQRSLDFETGVVSVHWEDKRGGFLRRLFISRPDDVAVLSIQGPNKADFDCRIRLAQRPTKALPGVDADYWNAEEKFRKGIKSIEIAAQAQWLAYRSSFRRTWAGSLQGYEGLAGIFAPGAVVSIEGNEIVVKNARQVLVLVRIRLLRDFSRSEIPAMKTELEALAKDGFDTLLTRHSQVHGEIFRRVRLDLGGGAEHNLPSEELVEKSKIGKMNLALLEKEFDFGRYAILSSSGDWPPALQGVWNGTWGPPWSGDYTQNGNVQSAIASELSGNMPECLLSYFNYIESFMADYRENATRLYGCRGIHIPSRMSSHGLNNHFDATWPMTFWTAGAGWAAHFYYDYWLYSGDRRFLEERAVPFMKEAAAFYEDFLIEGRDGKYVFNPSYSPENAPKNTGSQACINATMDIAVAKELLKNLIAACDELKIEETGIRRWREMLAKMPEYLISADGAVKEWAAADLEDNYDHRHCSHLYPLFDGLPADIAARPDLIQGFRRALEMRMEHRRRQKEQEMAFGLVFLGLAATSLRDAKTTYEVLDWLVNEFWLPSLTPTHNTKSIFNVDICGGLPAVVIRMLLDSKPGLLDILPARPAQWPRGRVEGLLARSQITVKCLSWDGPAIDIALASGKEQEATVRAPGRIKTFSARAGAQTLRSRRSAADRYLISLPAHLDVAIQILLEQPAS